MKLTSTILLLFSCLSFHAQTTESRVNESNYPDFGNCKTTQDSIIFMKNAIESVGEGRLSYFYEHFQYEARKRPTTFNKEILLFVEDKYIHKKRPTQ